jgi:hypothetical protein
MARAAANPPRIYCSAEWHLRKNPRAIAIYTLALRLTKGGKEEFLVGFKGEWNPSMLSTMLTL